MDRHRFPGGSGNRQHPPDQCQEEMAPRAERSQRGCLGLCMLLAIQLGLINASSAQEEMVFTSVGSEAMLHCQGDPATSYMKWAKDDDTILQWRSSQTLVARTNSKDPNGLSNRCQVDPGNGKFSMRVRTLQGADAGLYQCTLNGKKIQRVWLVLFQMNSSDSQPLVVSESLTLTLNSYSESSIKNLRITWRDPKKRNVTARARSMGIQINRILQLENIQLEDQGFLPDASVPATLHSRINDSVSLPCVFNFNIRSPPYSNHLPVKSGGLYRSDNANQLGQEKQALNVNKDIIHWTSEHREKLSGVQNSDLSVTLPKVQFADGGWYTFLVKFEHKELKKKLQLVVLRVSATPEGPLPPESQVTLNCEVSAHGSETQLQWTHVNGSKADEQKANGVGSLQITLRMIPESFGLWRCSVYTGLELKKSAEYKLEQKSSALFNWWIWAAAGAAALALMTVIVCAVICAAHSRRRRRQDRRVAWLMQQRTCQCKHKLLNEPHHP